MAKDYVQTVAETLIHQLRQGTAPWLKPWRAGERFLPYNPTTGKPYHGMNVVWLLSVAQDRGYADPRWLTYRQAQEQGAQVRRGEKGTPIQYWKWQGLEPVRDAAGQPVLDDDGRPKQERVRYERPRVWSAVVFNAAQIDGLPPVPERPALPDWERHEHAERLLAAGDPVIRYGGDRAGYNPTADRIVLPERTAFATADAFYATALHEKGHWTGHPSRLNRDLAHPFGSEGYAREELRAEIASLMLGEQLGIGHDPGQHAAYVQSWIRLLQDEPKEIFRAAADAGKIVTYVHGLAPQQQPAAAPAPNPADWTPEPLIEQALAWQARDRRRADLPVAAALRQGQPERALMLLEDQPDAAPLRQAIDEAWRRWREANGVGWGITPHDRHRFPTLASAPAPGDGAAPADTVPIQTSVPAPLEPKAVAQRTPTEPVILAVPYADKDAARRLGARWDRDNKVWYAPAGVDLTPLDRWLPATPPPVRVARDPRVEFAAALREAGLVLDGLPDMDGQLRRTPVDGDRHGKRGGAYVGYRDGHPAGYIQNFKTGLATTWKAAGPAASLSAQDRARLSAEAAQRRRVRAEEREQQYARAAENAEARWAAAAPVDAHPYLTAKGVPSYGVRQDPDGNLLAPLRDRDGQLWSLQAIDATGRKTFQKDGRVHGGHFLIGDPTRAGTMLIAEGYATAASLHLAAGHPVAVAFTAGNLAAVAEQVRRAYPHHALVIAADNDRWTPGNPGLTKAREAAARHGAAVIAPDFAGLDVAGKSTDFNDLARLAGLEEVRRQMQDQTPSLTRSQATPAAPPPAQATRPPSPPPAPATEPAPADARPTPPPAPLADSRRKILDVAPPLERREAVAPPRRERAEPNGAAPEPVAAPSTPVKDSPAPRPPATETATANSIAYDGPDPDKRRRPDTPPPALTEQYTVIVNRYYFKHRPNVEAFVDHGDRLRTRHDSPDAVQGMLALAESRGWDRIKVVGSDAFRQTVWLEGTLRGLTVTGYQPTAQDQAALAARQPVQTALPPSAEAALRPASGPRSAPRPTPTPAPPLGPARNPAPAPSPPSASPAPTVPVHDPAVAAGQQREARQAAVRDQVLQQARQAREQQAANERAAKEQQAAQAEKAQQLRDAFDTLDKRTALERFPELMRLYALVAEAHRFAKERMPDPQNRADFVTDIKEKGIQHLARGETLPPPTLQTAPARDPEQRPHQAATVRRAMLLLAAPLIALVMGVLSTPPARAADADDACGALLCLAGVLTGNGGGDACSGYIERYFRIVEKHHGDFSPSRTARKRMDFLAQCPSGESDTRSQVNDRYGRQRGL